MSEREIEEGGGKGGGEREQDRNGQWRADEQ